MPYPSLKHDRNEWLAVCKIKARAMVDVAESSMASKRNVEPFQDDDTNVEENGVEENNEEHLLNDPNQLFVDIQGGEENEDGDVEHSSEYDEEDRNLDDDVNENNNYQCDSE